MLPLFYGRQQSSTASSDTITTRTMFFAIFEREVEEVDESGLELNGKIAYQSDSKLVSGGIDFSPRDSSALQLSVVMPCLNENLTLGSCIGKALATMEQLEDSW